MCFCIGMEALLDFGNDCFKLGVFGGIFFFGLLDDLVLGLLWRKCNLEMVNLYGGEWGFSFWGFFMVVFFLLFYI